MHKTPIRHKEGLFPGGALLWETSSLAFSGCGQPGRPRSALRRGGCGGPTCAVLGSVSLCAGARLCSGAASLCVCVLAPLCLCSPCACDPRGPAPDPAPPPPPCPGAALAQRLPQTAGPRPGPARLGSPPASPARRCGAAWPCRGRAGKAPAAAGPVPSRRAGSTAPPAAAGERGGRGTAAGPEPRPPAALGSARHLCGVRPWRAPKPPLPEAQLGCGRHGGRL